MPARRLSAAAALFLAAALLVAACASEAGPDLRVAVRPVAVTMPADARLTLLDAVELRSPEPAFGGFSALEVAWDGARFVALSDSAYWFEGRLRREGDRITGVDDGRFGPLILAPGRESAVWRDAEGLSIPDPDLDGPRYVAFEREHRISRFDGFDGPEIELDIAIDTTDWRPNAGLEALASAPDGRLLVVREERLFPGGPSPGWWLRLEGGADTEPTPFLLERPDLYAVTSADFGPDGRLYVLGRQFHIFGGFHFVVWRFEMDGDDIGPGETLLELLGPDGADNAEGLAAWRDAEGRIRLTVITDDNFQLLQRTIIYDFAVID